MAAILISALQLPAQTNGTVRLALVAESPDALTAADVLTAELSSHANLQLLERNEIERVYREQGLSAANTDYLKLGQLLGADGLLLLDVNKTPQATNLTTRLVAVKPGAVLLDEGFSWPLKDMTGWASLFAAHLNPFVPKLAVLLKDAIPLSVVNLRSAVQSGEAQETEQQLKLLTIQRLSREPQLFVLERQQMQLLTGEKELKLDDSAFWNGSYLLEGVVDQNGYSEETITINARLTPPKGGAPVLFEVSGNRTNFMEVINQLAAKVNAALKVNSMVKEWNAADEAAQYCDEAKWAMRWSAYPEAQAAAESAWALGKHDMETATVRVRAYMAAIDTGGFSEYVFWPPHSLQEVTNDAWNDAPDRPWGLTLSEQAWRPNIRITFAFANKYPDVKNLDCAIRALETYQEFSQTLLPDNLKTNSAWFDLGVEDLTSASQVLLQFNFVHSSQQLAPEKLERLRVLARSAAGWISRSPPVHDTYWGGNTTTTNNEAVNAPAPHAIFGCEVNLGYLWQEKPEDGIVLYRELMTSPAFRQIHQGLWFRPSLTGWSKGDFNGVPPNANPFTIPAITAWNDEDRKGIPSVWNGFIQELKNSTNRLFQIEGKASTLNPDQLEERDGEGWLTIEPTENDLIFYKEMQFLVDQNSNDQKPYDPAEFTAVFQFRDYSLYQAKKIEYPLKVFQIRLDDAAERAPTEDKVKLQSEVFMVKSLQSNVNRILNAEEEAEAMQGKLAAQAEADKRNLEVFEKQIQFLTNNTPYEFSKFNLVFYTDHIFSKDQAAELLPLLVAYESNLVAQAAGKSSNEQFKAKNDSNWMEFLVGDKLKNILNPPPSPEETFEMQKQYLKENKPFDAQMFIQLFPYGFRGYSKTQALEIQPLLAAYKSNLLVQANQSRRTNSSNPTSAVMAQIGRVEDNVNYILNPLPAPKPNVPMVLSTNPPPIRVVPPKVVSHVPAKSPEIATNVLTVNKYIQIPLDRMAAFDITNWYLGSDEARGWAFSRWTGGKLLLDLQSTIPTDSSYSWSTTAIFNPANEVWQFIDHPQDKFSKVNYPILGTLVDETWDRCIELFDDSIFLSFAEQIHKYDFKTRQWHVLDIPGQKQSTLSVIDGHLYAANGENIFEIMDGGKGTRLLASTRRRPAASSLDSIDGFGSPGLFSSSDYLPCANIGSKIYGWDGKDWHDVITLDNLNSIGPIDDGSIFRSSPGKLWVWQKNQSAPDLWLDDAPKPPPGIRNNGLNQTNNPSLHPLGKSLPDIPLTGCIATFFKSNLYFLVEHTIFKYTAGGWTAVNNNGYNARLVCLSRDWPEPLVVPVKFDLKLMRNDLIGNRSTLSESTWIHFAGDKLYIGQADILGFFTIPISAIEANIEAQKRAVLAKKHDEDEAKRQLRDKMLAKYDHNHNGVIDPVEREEALDDPEFIESELDEIDANHNGWLDAEELVWFDANTNKTLEPKEQAGIEIAQHLLAERLLKQFDANGDGLLDRTEFNNLQDFVIGTSKPKWQLQFMDTNHDGYLDLGELEPFLQEQTSSGLYARRVRGSAVMNQMRMRPNQPVDARQSFKATVEGYWQYSFVVTNRPPFNRVPLVGVSVTNGAQSGKP